MAVDGLDDLNASIRIQDTLDDLAVFFANRQSVEPELIIARMSKPRTGLLLIKLNDLTGGARRPDFIALRYLLGHNDPLARLEGVPPMSA